MSSVKALFLGQDSVDPHSEWEKYLDKLDRYGIWRPSRGKMGRIFERAVPNGAIRIELGSLTGFEGDPDTPQNRVKVAEFTWREDHEYVQILGSKSHNRYPAQRCKRVFGHDVLYDPVPMTRGQIRQFDETVFESLGDFEDVDPAWYYKCLGIVGGPVTYLPFSLLMGYIMKKRAELADNIRTDLGRYANRALACIR